jgi:hypothetical protein
MAIQLARAIGEQRKPISPLEGLADIITKTGENIQAAQATKQAKAAKEQALKDAIAANIKYEDIEATPQQKAEYQNYIRNGLAELGVLQQSATPAQFQNKVNEFNYGVSQRKIKYKEDKSNIDEAAKREGEGTHDVEGFTNFLRGTPDMEQTSGYDEKKIKEEKARLESERDSEINNVEDQDQKSSIYETYNKKIDELNNLPAPEKKTIKGQQGYFSLPFEEQLKIDTKKELENRTIPSTPYMLEATKSLFGDYKGDYVKVTISPKSGTSYDIDEEQLEKDARYAANQFMNPPLSKSTAFSLLNRTIERQAMDKLAETMPAEELTYEKVAQAKYDIAYKKYIEEAQKKAYEEMLKIKKDKETKGGGMTFNFGQSEKQSKYNVGDGLTENLTNKKTDETREYTYYPLQGKAEGSNKLERLVGNYGNVAIEGVYKDNETNQITWAKITIPQKTKTTKHGEKIVTEEAQTKWVELKPREVSEIATEVGDKYFYGKTKAEKPVSETIQKNQAEQKGASKAEQKSANIQKANSQDEFNKKWSSLKSGESLIGPDGVTYKKK